MTQYNLSGSTVDQNYQNGLLPQRNQKNLFYQESSCRSNLANFKLSSENRRILKKTDNFNYAIIPLSRFDFDIQTQKQIYSWIKGLGWNFPISSVKKVFTSHIFNTLYLWRNQDQQVVAYSICYTSDSISHIAYVFYDPQYSHSNLPIRLTLQVIIGSHQQNLKYCYLGRFSSEIGFYKRTMPGFEYYQDGQWIKYKNPATL